MLYHDPSEGDQRHIPIFRHADTSKELTYEEAAKWFEFFLRKAGFPEVYDGLHSLRAGGATAYANTPFGGSLAAGFMGLWSSEAKNRYFHGCCEYLESTGDIVAGLRTQELALRPGPVDSYARGRPLGAEDWVCATVTSVPASPFPGTRVRYESDMLEPYCKP